MKTPTKSEMELAREIILHLKSGEPDTICVESVTRRNWLTIAVVSAILAILIFTTGVQVGIHHGRTLQKLEDR